MGRWKCLVVQSVKALHLKLSSSWSWVRIQVHAVSFLFIIIIIIIIIILFIYLFIYLFIFSIQCIFEDIANQIEKNFQGNIAFHTFRYVDIFPVKQKLNLWKGHFCVSNGRLNSNLHLVCFYAISDTLSCKESRASNSNQQYVLF